MQTPSLIIRTITFFVISKLVITSLQIKIRIIIIIIVTYGNRVKILIIIIYYSKIVIQAIKLIMV